MTTVASPRPRCYRCSRPRSHCLCDSLPTVPTRTAVVVIQHPNERSHPFGTARLMRLCMPNATVHTIDGGFARDLLHRIEVPDDAALLYPHPDAVELTDLSPAERPSTLVVLDGTWSHSRRIYHENPWLHGLRHMRIQPRTPSRYRIRKEPRPECLSTLEATVHALRVLEPETVGLESLIDAFDRMIDRQVDHVSTVPRQVRCKRPRNREPRQISPLLDEPGLVVLYAESSLPGGSAVARRELVQLAGARVDDGTTFEFVLRPSGAPPPAAHLRHMGLSLDEVENGIEPAAALEQLQERCGDGPFAAWTGSSLDWAQPVLPIDAPTTVLKTSYCNVRSRKAGFLEQVVEREGLQPVPTDCRGRAAGRLANALAVARWLREMRSESP